MLRLKGDITYLIDRCHVTKIVMVSSLAHFPLGSRIVIRQFRAGVHGMSFLRREVGIPSIVAVTYGIFQTFRVAVIFSITRIWARVCILGTRFLSREVGTPFICPLIHGRSAGRKWFLWIFSCYVRGFSAWCNVRGWICVRREIGSPFAGPSRFHS